MTEKTRELALAAAVIIVAAAGVAWGLSSDDVAAPAENGDTSRFVERAVFCPPAPVGKDSTLTVTAASEAEDVDVPVVFEPIEEEETELPAGRVLVKEPPDESAVDVVGYGTPVDATATASVSAPAEGAGAAGCARRGATQWLFAAGSSALGYDERILVYNPYPEEAVVRLSFFTPSGERVKANLTDVAVRAREWKEIKVNDFITLQPSLGVSVTAKRGRVVAWRAMLAHPKGAAKGVELSLGATDSAVTWYFAEGGAGADVQERIALLNPGTEEAIVTISLTTEERSVQPGRLVEISVPAGSAKSIPLMKSPPQALGGITGVSALVTSTNGVGVIAERTMTYEGDNLDGLAGEIGAITEARRWLVGPAANAPERDAVVLMNPGARDATVDITLMNRKGEPLTPTELTGIKLAAGLRMKVALDRWTSDKPVVALVVSDSPLVAERTAYDSRAGDVADVLGTPLRQ